MIELLSTEIAFVASIITVIGLIWGPKAWPAFYAWLGRIWKDISYPIRGTERRVDKLTELQEQLSKQVSVITTKLDALAQQFIPNGGSSIKDSLNRIELKQASNENIITFLINSLEVPMYKTDESGLCTWTSRAYCSLVLRDMSELLEWGWIICIHPDDVVRVRNNWASAIKDRRIFEDEFRIVRPNDEIIHVYSRASPTFFNNKVAGWVGSLEVVNGSKI